MSVSYNYAKIIFDTLIEVLTMKYYFPENPQKIKIVCPWLHDIDNILNQYGFSFPNIFFDPKFEEEDFYSISSILVTFLTKLDLINSDEVIVVTLQYGNQSKPTKTNANFNKNEAKFLLKVLDKGGNVLLHDHLHAKMIYSELGIISGSANLSNEACFFYSENINLFNKNDRNYQSNLNNISDFISEAETNTNNNIPNLRAYLQSYL